ncbi:hypothetical protein EUTSA_v10001149mg [Eutrema salsugineum]|uniref:YDG domain-containing protein n=1 Tax=Eutrema salsugineum TaxID=72664 RepID=V4L875_EUTSA|nr:YDG domain-containing protein At5g47160 [Eutrema salsugineum]ESQ39864.1 hypothetical protein EUTSA_v10001149mg [Eutrema salsugineum]
MPAFSVDKFEEVESVDMIVKKAGFSLPTHGNIGKGRLVSDKRKILPFYGSKVKPLSTEEAMRLIASHSKTRKISHSSTYIHRKFMPAKVLQKQRNSPEKKKKMFSNATALKAKTHQQTQNIDDQRRSNQLGRIPVMQENHITKACSPREKVLKALRLFRIKYKELDRDRVVWRGESKSAAGRLVFDTLASLVREGKQVNAEKMIGSVPGVKIGDDFQFKTELSIIGLHFNIQGGIDYISRGGLKLATSIVSSEGNNGYIDRFDSDVLFYSGQGGNVRSKDPKLIKDQKLVTGNLGLANSMREKNPVRVIVGKKNLDQRERGKRYVYVGLYLVQEYWRERGPRGNVLFKFKLCRASGQPPIDLRDYC